MKKLIIVGAGGLGREVLSWAIQAEMGQDVWRINGFLDANPRALQGYEYNIPILGDPKDYLPAKDEVFICAIGEPKIKLEACRWLEDASAIFTTLVHPSAVVGRNTKIGKGCILCPGSVVTSDARLGKHVIVNACASVGHDAIIGDGSTLSGHADVTGFAKLGRGVFLGSHVRTCMTPSASNSPG